MPPPVRRVVATASALATLAAGAASAQTPPAPATPSAQQLDRVEVQGNYNNAVGTSDAASQGTVTSKLIESRPTLRPAEVLEFVPGVIVTQHSGDGKANQYFLRGFNLDHGTDFATFIDGMPVNMPTHAHGHGYSDLNWLIPELVDRIQYRKGPYFAEEGDFASAGSARIRLFDTLPKGVVAATAGQNGYLRGLLANNAALGPGNLVYALEGAHNDGPWDNPENFKRFTGVVRYSAGPADARSSITGMAYSARWNATDQIPERAVSSGLVGRFGTLDPTDHGDTSRYSLSYRYERQRDDGVLKVNAYAVQSRLNLFSNFTYFLEQPIDLDPTKLDGDQFEQAERRRVFGFDISRSFNGSLAGRDSVTTVGAQVRHDRLSPVGLYTAVGGARVGVTQESVVRQTLSGVYAENATQWADRVRTVVGLRGDTLRYRVRSSVAGNSGDGDASIVSPKVSLIVGPWAKTEVFVNSGYGYHSNDTRGATATVTAKDPGVAADRVTPLVRSRGEELGVRTEIVPGLQSSLALWQLRLGSELVFVGDAGETEANRPSKRRGIEWTNHYVARDWLLFDLDLALSRSRFTQDPDGIGTKVPGAVNRVASFGATVTDLGPWFGQFQVRYFGPRPLIENDSVRSKSTTLAYLRAGYKVTANMRVALDVFNLFDRKASDIDYYYVSRLRGEPVDGQADVHFHPVEPRSFRLTVTANF